MLLNQLFTRNLHVFLVITIIFAAFERAEAQNYPPPASKAKNGFTIMRSTQGELVLKYTPVSYSIVKNDRSGEELSEIRLNGNFLPSNEGMPNTPTVNTYIAIPKGSKPKINITNIWEEVLEDISLEPAPNIPFDTDRSQPKYVRSKKAYSTNAFLPAEKISLSNEMYFRGTNVVILNVSPFQYNPVTRQLKVIKNIEFSIEFEHRAYDELELKFRNPWWEPILQDNILNYSSLPKVSFSRNYTERQGEGADYVIVTPNSPIFVQWADSIRKFRSQQGILTKVVKLSEIGGNNVNAINSFFEKAMTWEIPPVAALLLGDHGTDDETSIVSPIWNSYCASDNMYADVNNDNLPDLVMARITARNEDELKIMVSKFIEYETNPPTNPEFYKRPITALGWQTERWFQICSEVIGGFWKNKLGKNPVRINDVYGGNPYQDPWSTATGTETVLNFFGPDGLGYIPETPYELGKWTGGSAQNVVTAINSGAFILQHRDHGFENGWGQPEFTSQDINSLTNSDLSFIMSVNCLTGKFNSENECFTEKFHRHTYNGKNAGALGLLAATEVSFSFVNDVFVWGLYDIMWPEFLPDHGVNDPYRNIIPALGMAAGKYFLHASNWPSNPEAKEYTYNLFHHHGDAFIQLYTEVPETLTVLHNPEHISGMDYFAVQADAGSIIGITCDNKLLSSAVSDGNAVELKTGPLAAGSKIRITVTKQNHYRYSQEVPVIQVNKPYLATSLCTVNDADANNNQVIDFNEKVYLDLEISNMGTVKAEKISTTLSCNDPYVVLSNEVNEIEAIEAGNTIALKKAFALQTTSTIPNYHPIQLKFTFTDGSEKWESNIILKAHAPILNLGKFWIDDSKKGNNNGKLDINESADLYISLTNSGSANVANTVAKLSSSNKEISFESNSLNFGELQTYQEKTLAFAIKASDNIPEGTMVPFSINIESDYGVETKADFKILIGRYGVLIVDANLSSQSGLAFIQALDELNISYEYTKNIPSDFSNYKSVFLSLGIYMASYALSENNSSNLANYLNKGGNLYMEGRSTWHDDEQLQIHQMFNTEVVPVGWFNMDSIQGEAGSFASTMQFEYAGINPISKYYFAPLENSKIVMKYKKSQLGCITATQTPKYKTIASAVEFGALIDGKNYSTKKDLMEQILKFFGVIQSESSMNDAWQNKETIVALPNPGNGMFMLNINDSYKAKVYDISGKLIMESTVNHNNNSIDLSEKSSGIYFIQLSGKTIHSIKIIKK